VEFDQAPSLLEFIRMEDELSEKAGHQSGSCHEEGTKNPYWPANSGRSDSHMREGERDYRDF